MIQYWKTTFVNITYDLTNNLQVAGCSGRVPHLRRCGCAHWVAEKSLDHSQWAEFGKWRGRKQEVPVEMLGKCTVKLSSEAQLKTKSVRWETHKAHQVATF